MSNCDHSVVFYEIEPAGWNDAPPRLIKAKCLRCGVESGWRETKELAKRDLQMNDSNLMSE